MTRGEHGPLLQRHPTGKMAHTGIGHEGNGQMGTDAPVGPVEHRPHPQVVFGSAETLFNLPELTVSIEEVLYADAPEIGDNTVQPVPMLGGTDLLLVDLETGIADNPDVAVIAARAEQLLRRRAFAQAPDQLRHRPAPVMGVLAGPFRTP